MKKLKKPFDVSGIELGRDGRVELSDEELVAIEREADFAVAGGYERRNESCSSMSNSSCWNVTCGSSWNSLCANYACMGTANRSW